MHGVMWGGAACTLDHLGHKQGLAQPNQLFIWTGVSLAGALCRKHVVSPSCCLFPLCPASAAIRRRGLEDMISLCLIPVVWLLGLLLFFFCLARSFLISHPLMCLIPFCCLVALCFYPDLPSQMRWWLLFYHHICTRVEEPVSSSFPSKADRVLQCGGQHCSVTSIFLSN